MNLWQTSGMRGGRIPRNIPKFSEISGMGRFNFYSSWPDWFNSGLWKWRKSFPWQMNCGKSGKNNDSYDLWAVHTCNFTIYTANPPSPHSPPHPSKCQYNVWQSRNAHLKNQRKTASQMDVTPWCYKWTAAYDKEWHNRIPTVCVFSQSSCQQSVQ